MAVSGRTGQGSPALRAALDRLVARLPAPEPDAPVRLWVDRAFTVRGSGTVVTGTLGAGHAAGRRRAGRSGDRRVRVRGLQSLGTAYEQVRRRRAGRRQPARRRARRRLAAATRCSPPARGAPPALSTCRLTRARRRRCPPSWCCTSARPRVPVRVRPLDGDAARLQLPRPAAAAGRRPGAAARPGRAVGGRRRPGARRRPARAAPPRRRPRPGQRRSPAADGAARPRRRGRPARRRPRAPTCAALGVAVAPDDPACARVGRLAGRAGDLAGLDRGAGRRGRRPRACGRRSRPGCRPRPRAATVGVPDLRLLAAAGRGRRARAGRRPGPAAGRGAVARAAPRRASREVERRLREAPSPPRRSTSCRRWAWAPGRWPPRPRPGGCCGCAPPPTPTSSCCPTDPARAMRVLAGLPQPFTLSQARQALGTTRRVAVPLLEHLDGRGWTRRLDAGCARSPAEPRLRSRPRRRCHRPGPLGQADLPATRGLRRVHRPVPGPEQLVGALDPGRQAQPHADAHPPERVRRAQHLRRAARRLAGQLHVPLGQVAQQDDELVAAEPGHQVTGAHRLAHPLRHLDQQRVAGGVAVHVVELLEPVQVAEEQGDRFGAAVRLRQRGGQGRAVGQPGERVVVGGAAQLAQQVQPGVGLLRDPQQHLQRGPVGLGERRPERAGGHDEEPVPARGGVGHEPGRPAPPSRRTRPPGADSSSGTCSRTSRPSSSVPAACCSATVATVSADAPALARAQLRPGVRGQQQRQEGHGEQPDRPGLRLEQHRHRGSPGCRPPRSRRARATDRSTARWRPPCGARPRRSRPRSTGGPRAK